ncbi:MAG: OmpA family protein [Flavobacteriaceae bacterium]|nr:OmpA family protein [Flavobacteriaceae bacterium]
MKKITLVSLLLVTTISVNAQDKEVKKDTASSDFNKWTIEATVGQAKGVKPYSKGYYSGDPVTFLGKPQANSFSVAARYMISPKFGVKAGLHYEEIKNIKNSGSLPFKMQQIGITLQGVVNATRLFDIQDDLGRFGLLFHGGLKIDQMTSKTKNIIEHDHNYNQTEYNGGLIVGVSPQFRFSNRLAVLLDITIQNNFRQHFNWDGTYSNLDNNLNGQQVTTSLGLTYSLGRNKMHGDWAVIRDKNLDQIEALDKRVGEVETLMNDTDKDGVPDYLDQENNSVAGVAVDTRGKMVDINRNGVPDELERYIEKTSKESSEKSNSDTIKRLVNEGYVTTYFDTAKVNPTNVSTEGIDFIRTYLKNNPTASVDIVGHADEIGSNERNNALSKGRAEAVKAILVKAGIDASRLHVVTIGEDTSVDVDSEGARKLVRRVTFKIKE